MNKHHKYFIKEFETAEKPENKWADLNNYLGSSNKLYGLKSGQRKDILKKWKAQNRDLSYQDYLDLIISLNEGDSYEEKSISSAILNAYPKYRKQIDLKLLDKLLDNLSGWAEVDNLCQSTFTDQELLSRWPEWEKTLKRFNKDKNISKRRASLVLLIKSVRKSSDDRLHRLAYQNIKNVMKEDDILITKAISWLLREMTKTSSGDVKKFLNDNEDELPKIALRETRRKLETGKK